ncbi:hypothetical protein V1522DRAFT_430989 [Lipomyces starkeyi]
MRDYGAVSPGHEGASDVGANVRGWKVGDGAGVKPLWDTCSVGDLCQGGFKTYYESANDSIIESHPKAGDWAVFMCAGGGVGHWLAKVFGSVSLALTENRASAILAWL